MNFTSKFNIGDMVQFVEETKTLAKIIEIKITPARKVAYNVQLNDANHTFLVDIHESRLEKAEQSFIFAGHKVTQGNDKSKVQIGCKTVTKSDVENLIDLADKFEIFDFSVTIYNGNVSNHAIAIKIEQVRELYAKFFQSQERSRFELFLINCKIHNQFINNMKKYGSCETLSELESRYQVSGLIMHAFGWGRTPEGANFWQNWDSKWNQYLNQR